MYFGEKIHLVNGITPLADAFAGTVSTDIVNMEGYGQCIFIVHQGANADNAASTATVVACSTVGAAATTAVAFKYRKLDAYSTSHDTMEALTAAAAVGVSIGGQSNNIYWIEVDAATVGATGYNYVRLTLTETDDHTVTGGVVILLVEPRYAGATDLTAIE